MARFHFGGGCPDPGSFPLDELAAAAQRVLPRLREALCNYPERQGYRPLREVAAARFQRREGVALDPDTFCLTTGSQQAITLVCQALVRPGDPVLVEEFLYPGTLRALRHVGARVVGIPMDEGGMRMDALEAALKVKEVSYVHAEGFAGGELKHGVIALIEPGTPCLVLAPNDETHDDILSGAMEVRARGGTIIGIAPTNDDAFDYHIPVADLGEASGIVQAVPAQLLGYYLALLRGHDPDKPRNLAKSVTVK